MCLTAVERKPISCDNVGTAGNRATHKELGHRYQKASLLCTLGYEEDVQHTVPCDRQHNKYTTVSKNTFQGNVVCGEVKGEMF